MRTPALRPASRMTAESRRGGLASWLGLVCLLFTFALPLPASQVRPVNLEELTARADRIFVGRCIETQVVPSEKLGAVTRVTFAVERVVKGDLEATLTIETVLDIACAPLTWPIGMGREFRGIYDLRDGVAHLYQSRDGSRLPEVKHVQGLASAELEAAIGADSAAALREEVELVHGATPVFDHAAYLAGKQTPVFFGAAIHNYGVRELLDAFATLAPPPQPRATSTRVVAPDEPAFSGFVFKIQANMDPAHRDRIAFLRVCSGTYDPGMRMYQTRLRREVRVGDAITFMAADRQHVEEAYAGDIIGLHNHGTINIGDSFTQGEPLEFTGIPSFAPELFRRAVLRDPLKLKALQKGLAQLCEEGATQLFRPLLGNDLILGAVGPLQFEVAAYRLRDEYSVEAVFESVAVAAARWVRCDDKAHLDEFVKKLAANVARDHAGQLVYLAPSTVALALTQERWPKIQFFTTRESSAAA